MGSESGLMGYLVTAFLSLLIFIGFVIFKTIKRESIKNSNGLIENIQWVIFSLIVLFMVVFTLIYS